MAFADLSDNGFVFRVAKTKAGVELFSVAALIETTSITFGSISDQVAEIEESNPVLDIT